VDEQFSEKEAQARFEAALKTPPSPLKDKPKVKKADEKPRKK
jgi:hypothetical protein